MLARSCLPQFARQLPVLSSILQGAQEVCSETGACSSTPSTSYESSGLYSQPYQACFTRGMAFKKAGGTARQNPDTLSRNLGVKFLQNEVVFPGHIIVRQRGTKWHPGHNVGLGKDHTIFATTVGFVQFTRQEIVYASGRSKECTLVNVVPINGDWSPAYKKLEEEMVARRAVIKRQMLKSRAVEAALHFPMPKHTQWTVPTTPPSQQQQQQALSKASPAKQTKAAMTPAPQ